MLSKVWRFQDSPIELLYSERSPGMVRGPRPEQPVSRATSRRLKWRPRDKIHESPLTPALSPSEGERQNRRQFKMLKAFVLLSAASVTISLRGGILHSSSRFLIWSR